MRTFAELIWNYPHIFNLEYYNIMLNFVVYYTLDLTQNLETIGRAIQTKHTASVPAMQKG